jgi:hypothetical protein
VEVSVNKLDKKHLLVIGLVTLVGFSFNASADRILSLPERVDFGCRGGVGSDRQDQKAATHDGAVDQELLAVFKEVRVQVCDERAMEDLNIPHVGLTVFKRKITSESDLLERARILMNAAYLWKNPTAYIDRTKAEVEQISHHMSRAALERTFGAKVIQDIPDMLGDVERKQDMLANPNAAPLPPPPPAGHAVDIGS